MVAPTAYVVAVFDFGMSHGIIEISELLGAGKHGSSFLKDRWLLSFEYVLFAAFFMVSILLFYGIKGLKQFLISLVFLGATGFFSMIDTFYPFGNVTVLQSFVSFTAWSATVVLSWMNYGTRLFSLPDEGIVLAVAGPPGGASFYLF